MLIQAIRKVPLSYAKQMSGGSNASMHNEEVSYH
jgi:hypothetical protein